MNKGIGLVSIIITIAIIGVMVWGVFYFEKSNSSQNQIQAGQTDIQAAKDAANQENQYNQNLEDLNSNLDSGGGVNYRSATQGLK